MSLNIQQKKTTFYIISRLSFPSVQAERFVIWVCKISWGCSAICKTPQLSDALDKNEKSVLKDVVKCRK